MNLQELKEKIIDKFSVFHMPVNDRCRLFKSIDEIFQSFEQSNKSEEEPDTNYVMKFELEEMKKEIFEQYAYTKKYIACIDECRAEIADLRQDLILMQTENLKEKPVSEPKQETYYIDKISVDKYNIINSKSGNPKTAIIATSEFWNIAVEICRFYNSQEGK